MRLIRTRNFRFWEKEGSDMKFQPQELSPTPPDTPPAYFPQQATAAVVINLTDDSKSVLSSAQTLLGRKRITSSKTEPNLKQSNFKLNHR